MTATPQTRRPQFLTDIPDVPAAAPLRLAPAGARAAAATRPARGAGSSQAPQRPGAQVAEGAREEPGEARKEALDRVAAAVETLRAQADHLGEQVRADAIEIAFLVARKILEAELKQGPEAIFALVRSAVRKAGASRRVSVRLHPEDAARLEEELGHREDETLSAARIELVPDTSVERGDCRVDTDFGQVDGRLGTRLAEVRRAVDTAGEEGS
ncbi:MAG TPA: flagellar assembly protein FliH [Anaeromyxobacteraceae bacterium]|nr:flagellar assembly protein FliH [Anaeromyxobacteraceae bacterium]